MMDTRTIAAREEWLEREGQPRIFVRSWAPADDAKALVVICHGFNSHGGQYGWVAEQLVEQGFVVYALDLRGRGRSEGERYYVETIDEYVGDLGATVALARTRTPDLPVFVLGHSAGGVVSCTYALQHQEELAGLICESFAFQVPAPDIALAVLKGLSHIAPHVHVLRLNIDDFSRDPEVVRAMHADPMIADEVQPTLTVAAMVRGDEHLAEAFPQFRLPLLILHGTADKVTRPSGSQRFHDEAGSPDKTLRLYDGHAHDLLNDLGKQGVLAEIVAWMQGRLLPVPA